jgi:hypothetical protein
MFLRICSRCTSVLSCDEEFHSLLPSYLGTNHALPNTEDMFIWKFIADMDSDIESPDKQISRLTKLRYRLHLHRDAYRPMVSKIRSVPDEVLSVILTIYLASFMSEDTPFHCDHSIGKTTTTKRHLCGFTPAFLWQLYTSGGERSSIRHCHDK